MHFAKIPGIFVVLFICLLPTACRKDFDDINKNPFQPTDATIEALFNGVLSSLPNGWWEQFYVHNEMAYELTQQAALIAHSWPQTFIGSDEIWNNYYGALRNIREIERRLDNWPGEQEEIRNARAMLKIILAYKTFKVTDLFGDIPFAEAGRGNESAALLRPKYDAQEDIYKTLLNELQWAVDNIEINPSATTPGGKPLFSFREFDTLFKSDMKRWRQFANALRLRHAMRMVEKDRAFAEPIIEAILDDPQAVPRSGEEICLWPRSMKLTFDSHHWSFYEHKNLRMGSAIWKWLSPEDKDDGSGIIDPRTYIFFDTNNKNKWAAYPNAPGATPPQEGGVPYNGGRDQNYTVKGASCQFSPFNYYLIRDNEDVPEILVTAAEMYFIKAEAYKRGIGAAQNDFDAEEQYAEGIRASIKFWFSVVNQTQRWTVNKPATPSEGEIFQFIFHPKISFSGNGFPLEYIYAQEWIDLFRQPLEAYALARRTGKTPREGAPLTQFRIPYPSSESEYNQANWQAQVQKMGGSDGKEVKVWWML